MPKPPIPEELQALLREPNPAVIATLKPDGAPHSVATWYLWENGRVLVNMDASRARLDYLRKDPRVSLTVLDGGDWYRHVSIRGRVVSIEPDEELKDIDRLCRHYRDQDYPSRDPRFSAWIEVDTWHAWNA
jgi:PPOX class probable F420-dependent enzyme